VVIIYLQKGFSPSVLLLVHFLREGAPTIIWVSRSWGLPRSTLAISRKTTSLWHFQGNSAILINSLGTFPAVSRKGCPSLWFR